MNSQAKADAPAIEYFYSAHSAFAWIGSAQLRQIARDAGRQLIHRPFDFIPVVTAANNGVWPELSARRYQYFFGREIDRWAEFRGVETIHTRPTWHDEPLGLANGMIIAAQQLDQDVDALSHEILGAHWRDNANINDRDALRKAAKSAAIDPEPLLALALSGDIQAQHMANTREAIKRSVFGSPTYFADGDMFYGQDHLEMLERALNRRFAWHG